MRAAAKWKWFLCALVISVVVLIVAAPSRCDPPYTAYNISPSQDFDSYTIVYFDEEGGFHKITEKKKGWRKATVMFDRPAGMNPYAEIFPCDEDGKYPNAMIIHVRELNDIEPSGIAQNMDGFQRENS